MLTGRTDDAADWMTGFGIDDRGIQMVCVDITVDGETVVDGRIGGPFLAGTEPTEVVVAFMNAGRAEGARWYVVRGTVPAAAARLELSFDRSDPVEAQIATVGPEDGWRWYAAVVPHSGSRNPEIVAVAYDPENAPLAMGVDVFHDADSRLRNRSR